MQTDKTKTMIGEVLAPMKKTYPKPKRRSITRTRTFIPMRTRKICTKELVN